MKLKLAFVICLISFTVFAQEKKGDVFEVARYGAVSQMDSIYKASPTKIDSVNAMGFSPLILACYRGNTEVAMFIIDKTKSLDYACENGTALTAAVFKNNMKLTEKLLNMGADPNIGDVNGLTPLMYAIQFKNIPMVKVLLKNGADKTQKDKSGKGSFEYAVFSKNQEIINLLKN